ncbi:hypothetical protein C8E89_14217 [Mycolicibacterium moriokaense]|uniref:Uncharacterized protein n=1 Tax=Mycolicibacterium moriokaense TaxID=39691 RepID=A0A318H5D3_9MYCO|nr:hypothetical protein C8E89_14217 [Mycolicibacterium moriokaense]
MQSEATTVAAPVTSTEKATEPESTTPSGSTVDVSKKDETKKDATVRARIRPPSELSTWWRLADSRKLPAADDHAVFVLVMERAGRGFM